MVFAYPGLVFTAEQTQTKAYKMYAVLVNILELLQCSSRFVIYFCFTTQFRQILFKIFEYDYKSNKKAKQNINNMQSEMVTVGAE
jgi:hypothetical protein